MTSFEKQILVVIKDPGQEPRVDPLFDNTLEAFQKAVGGYIETVTVFRDLVLIVNEEGRILGLPYNCHFCGMPIYGPVVAAFTRGVNFASIPASCVPMIMKELKEENEK